MPDSVENNIIRVLNGLPLEDDESEICDFSLEELNHALESQGVAPTVDPKYKPILGETVTYIVAGVILNSNNEVLMIQEAKESCAGKWYLPAGHIEKGESICSAFEREVLEETGLIVHATTLLLVECARGSWIRFVLTGVISGGTLKTPSQADEESLQAKWVANLDEMPLRAKDLVHLVDKARELSEARHAHDKSWHNDILPAPKAHSSNLLRLVVVIKKRANNRVHVLLSERTAWHLPVCQIHPLKNLHSTLRRFMVELFGAELAKHRPHGLLSVEHNPNSGQDGVCFTLLVVFKPPLEEVPIVGKCVWHETSKEVGEQLMNYVAAKNSTFPLHVIH